MEMLIVSNVFKFNKRVWKRLDMELHSIPENLRVTQAKSKGRSKQIWQLKDVTSLGFWLDTIVS